MLNIITGAPYVTVINISTVTDARDQLELVRAWNEVLPLFSQLKGFIGAAVHKNLGGDGNTVTVYLQWKTAEDHHNCENSRDWPMHPEARRFVQLFFVEKRAKCVAQVVTVESVFEPSCSVKPLSLSEQLASQGRKLNQLETIIDDLKAAIRRNQMKNNESVSS
ncbi:MAG: antibiotic biosynthesis monooxygenase [Pirellula sp.]